MTVDFLLDKLDGVRQVAAGRWRARCPAHDGRNRDVLSIAETTDGIVLVKCFHGCTAADVVAAVGLEVADLFPREQWQQTGQHHARPRRYPRADWPPVIVVLERDLILAKIVLEDISRGLPINDVDAVACGQAATRIYTLIQEVRRG